MTLCETITKIIIRMTEEEGKNLDEIANEMCPKIEYGREKIIRIIKDFLGEEYLIQHAETLKYDVGKAQLAKKRKTKSHEKIDAGTDAVIESDSVTPIASCKTTVQAGNTERTEEAGQAKGQEQEKVLEEPGACCQEKSPKANRKKKDSEEETTGQEPNDAPVPVENKFNVLVEAIKKLVRLFSIEDVKKALAVAESDISTGLRISSE